MGIWTWILVYVFLAIQILYLLAMLIDVYFYTRPVNHVDMSQLKDIPEEEYPFIVLFYPVLREHEETMRTTFHSLDRIDYPRDKYAVVAIPNQDDRETVASVNGGQILGQRGGVKAGHC